MVSHSPLYSVLFSSKSCCAGKSRDGTDREHVVVHVLWSGWPDKSVPLSATGAIRAIVRTQTMSPLVVHCSAGWCFYIHIFELGWSPLKDFLNKWSLAPSCFFNIIFVFLRVFDGIE